MANDPDDITDRERILLIRAVAEFSESCDLPDLTPSCPFYEVGANGPECAEQCRDLLERYPADLVVPDETSLGVGLGAVRRMRPRRGPQPDEKAFDAREFLLQDRSKALEDWRTTSLLTEVRDQFLAPLASGPAVVDLIDAIIARNIDFEQIFLDRLVLDWAAGLFLRTLFPQGENPEIDPAWTRVMDELVEAQGLAPGMAQVGDDLELDSNVLMRLVSWGREVGAKRALCGDAPSLHEFHTDIPRMPQIDSDSAWLIDRFTRTYLSEWARESLLSEWRYLHSQRRGCAAASIMQERKIDSAVLASEIAHRTSQDDNGPEMAGSLRVSSFASVALKLLIDGKYAEAASIYRALVELRPDDYEAMNNLGFCLIPTSASEAITALEKCVGKNGTSTTMLTRINLTVAWYLAGDTAKAKSSLAEARSAPDPDGSGYLWTISPDAGSAPKLEYQTSLLRYALRLDDVLALS